MTNFTTFKKGFYQNNNFLNNQNYCLSEWIKKNLNFEWATKDTIFPWIYIMKPSLLDKRKKRTNGLWLALFFTLCFAIGYILYTLGITFYTIIISILMTISCIAKVIVVKHLVNKPKHLFKYWDQYYIEIDNIAYQKIS